MEIQKVWAVYWSPTGGCRRVTETLAEAAAELAVEGTAAMANNSYKIQEVRALIKKMILDMGAVQA